MFGDKKNNKKEILKWGIGGGLAEIIYIALIALLLGGLGNAMGNVSQILSIALFLLLLVFSVGISGLFIFGYPAVLALQKRFKEAIFTILVSFATLIVFFSLLILVILYINNLI